MLNLKEIQKNLCEESIDGWLLFDFKRLNPIACQILNIIKDQLLTRRFFYFIPQKGAAVKIVHQIEKETLDHLPGEKKTYTTFKELREILLDLLQGSKKIAMEYSPEGAIPEISKVDAGTVDLVRGLGPEVISSGDLLQLALGRATDEQLKSHQRSANILSLIIDETWNEICAHLNHISEYDVQQLMLKKIHSHGCVRDAGPICAINAHSANPHFVPTSENTLLIKEGDWILLDIWCKEDVQEAFYADICRVGVVAFEPTARQEEIFQIVKKARDVATEFVREKFLKKEPVSGRDVDLICRKIIEEAGFGPYFIHRTGHNIDTNDHGRGAHLDSFETDDYRKLIPKTCFSIEPGIYLPNEFGVRLEYDVCILPDGSVEVTGGIQNTIMTFESAKSY